MDSYADRLSKFNDMVTTTADHIETVRQAATKIKESNDPIGTGIGLTGAIAGGVSGIAGAVGGVQHFKDFKKMYQGISNKLQNGRNGLSETINTNNSGGRQGTTSEPDNTQSSGANASDENAAQTTQAVANATPAQGVTSLEELEAPVGIARNKRGQWTSPQHRDYAAIGDVAKEIEALEIKLADPQIVNQPSAAKNLKRRLTIEKAKMVSLRNAYTKTYL